MIDWVYILYIGGDEVTSKNIKREIVLPVVESEAFFKQLAETIDIARGEMSKEADADISDFRKFELTIKRKGADAVVKLKCKYAEKGVVSTEESRESSENTPEEESRLKYKDLKKRMKKAFKAICASVKVGELPDAEAAKNFIEDSKLMTSFEGKGEAMYERYAAACDEFKTAMKKKDVDKVAEAVKNLDAIRKEAHREYK